MFEKSMKRHSNDTHINETEYSKQYAVRCNWFMATTFPQLSDYKPDLNEARCEC